MILYFLLFFITNSQEWTIFNKDNSDLLSNDIQDVIIDNEDNLWLINNFSTIFKIKGGIWTKYNSQNTGISEFDFASLSLGLNNMVFAGPQTDSKSWICKFVNNKWEETSAYNLDIWRGNLRINDLIELENGSIWIATDFGAYYFKNGLWSSYLQSEEGRDLWGIIEFKNKIYLFKNNVAYCYNDELDRFDRCNDIFHNDAEYSLHIGPDDFAYSYSKFRNEKLMKYDGSNWFDFKLAPLDTNLRRFIYTQDKRFIFQTNHSVYECFGENNFVKLFTIPDTLRKKGSFNITLQDVDSKGNYWFTIFNEGLIKCSLDINSVPKKVEIKLYPNPSQTSITVTAEQAITSLALYSLNLSKIKDLTPNHTTTQEINISTLPAGIYFIMVNDEFVKFVRE